MSGDALFTANPAELIVFPQPQVSGNNPANLEEVNTALLAALVLATMDKAGK